MTMILGVTSTGIVYPVRVDSDGQLVGSGQSYYSGAWRKNPLAFGISGQIKKLVQSTDLAAGTSTYYSAAVPADTIWVLTNISIRYIGTVTNVLIRAGLYDGAINYTIFIQSPPVSYVEYDRQGQWIYMPGDKISLEVNNATLHDTMTLLAVGYSIAYTA